MKDTTRARMMILLQMDNYIKYDIGDDVIFYDVWCATGLPDGYDLDDVKEIAEDDELWMGCVETFAECCKMGLDN